MNALEQGDREAAAVQKTPNRVTLDHILSLIDAEEYWNPAATPQVTVCALTLKNGFTVIGQSAPADAGNFDSELGRKFAREDAIGKVWPLEGYLLRENLAGKNHD